MDQQGPSRPETPDPQGAVGLPPSSKFSMASSYQDPGSEQTEGTEGACYLRGRKRSKAWDAEGTGLLWSSLG